HLEHKTEIGGVVLDLRDRAAAAAAAARLSGLTESLLVEEMIGDGVAELLVGVIVDPQFGQVLVLGAGGVAAELLADSITLLPPWDAESIRAALGRTRIGRLLAGYRGKPPGDVTALVDAIVRIGEFAAANADSLAELDVNPLIVRPAGSGVAAVDVLIRSMED
ncbi:MAG TPA: acetate--CoA ligase family protein, partial [Steroidobacteraceae bacterium]|nr:acetate--CoA ligase family protein [Steroidobacteraceae bacterium]